jgi:WD40 repeat protein
MEGLCRKLTGHNFYAFSPDGKTLASASDDNTLKLWGVATGACTATLRGHTGRVNCCAFSPDGKTLASASSDHTLKLWDPATGACTETLTGHTNYVRCCAFSPDGKTLASASWKTLKLWDPATGACTATLTGHTNYVRCCAFSPDGKTLASGSDDNTLKLWDPATGTCTATLTGHPAYVICCAFSPDGKTLASASSDNTLKLWDPATGACTATLTGHTSSVLCCAFSPCGKTIASGCDDKTLKLWDIATGACTATLTGHTSSVYCCAFSLDGKTLASASKEKGSGLILRNMMKLWDVDTNACTATLEYTGSVAVTGCAVSPDGKTLASASDDNMLRLWDVKTRKCTAMLLSGEYKTTDSFGSVFISPKLWGLSLETLAATTTRHAEIANTKHEDAVDAAGDARREADELATFAEAAAEEATKKNNADKAARKLAQAAAAAAAAAEAKAAAAAAAEAAAVQAKVDAKGAVVNWLSQAGFAAYTAPIMSQLGVTCMADIYSLKACNIKPLGLKVADNNRFLRAAKESAKAEAAAAKANAKATAAAAAAATAAAAAAATAAAAAAAAAATPVAGFQPRPFPGVGASVNEMDGHGEALVTMHMRALGFRDAVPSGCVAAGEVPTSWDDLRAKAVAYVRHKDGGIDVVASGAVAQVKSKFRSATSRGDVSQLKGDTAVALHAGKRLLFYAVSYAAGVVDYANETGIALFAFTAEGVVSPANTLAEQLACSGADGGSVSGDSSLKRKRAEAPTTDWTAWTKLEVEQWLESEGFVHYTPCFAMVEGADLKGLAAGDLAALPPPAIPAFVAKKMLAAFASL